MRSKSLTPLYTASTRENGACGIDVIEANVELRLTMGQQLG
jgi:hypothetical protein